MANCKVQCGSTYDEIKANPLLNSLVEQLEQGLATVFFYQYVNRVLKDTVQFNQCRIYLKDYTLYVKVDMTIAKKFKHLIKLIYEDCGILKIDIEPKYYADINNFVDGRYSEIKLLRNLYSDDLLPKLAIDKNPIIKREIKNLFNNILNIEYDSDEVLPKYDKTENPAWIYSAHLN